MFLKKFKLLLLFTSYCIVATSENGFIENKGQIADKNGIVKNDINFKLELPGTNAYFKSDGIIYHFYRSIKKTKDEYSEKDWEYYNKGDLNAIGEKVYFFRIDFKLLNTNKNIIIEKYGAQNVLRNYYLGHCSQGMLGVNSFNEIIYKNIYDNIDIRYYFHDNALKYEFIIHPGGDVNNIKFKYDGAVSTTLNNDKLVVENNFNTIEENAPYSYSKETSKQIDSKFVINNNIVSFEIADYNPTQTVIIDPTITWSSYYNNNNSSDFKCNSAFDSQLNIYTCFSTYGNTWTTINAGAGQYYDAVKDGITDVVIARFNTNYSQQWVTYYGGNGGDYLCGTGGDYGKTIGVDANGNVFVGGYTNGAANNFPTLSSTTPGAFYKDQTKIYGGDTGFLLKFDGSGVRQWATMFQHEQANTSSAGMRINGICVNGSKIYFTGETYRFNNNDIPLRVLAGAYNNATFVGDQDVFIGRFDNNCILEWCTYFNAGNTAVKAYKQGTDLHVDASGNLLYVGQVSASIPANGASAYLLNPGGGAYFMNIIAGGGEIQVAKFNSSLQPVWSTLYGSTDLDRVSEVSSDINGNILVACRTVSGNNFPTANPGGAFVYTTKQAPGTWSSNGAQDGGIMKFTPTGALYWATYVGGTSASTNSTPGIASDNAGNIYAIGYTNTNNFPTQNLAGSFNQPNSAGGTDMVLMRFTPTGSLSWSTYYGGSADESCYGLKITPSSKHSSCGYYKQFCTFSTNSAVIPLANPGSPAFYEAAKNTSYANGILLIEENAGASLSTPATSILGNTTICAPASTTLSVNGGNLASGSVWTWHTGSCSGPVIGTGSSIVVNPVTTTTYYVNAIGTCDTSACVSITVTVSTSVTGSFNQTICTGNSYFFNGQNLTTSGQYKDTLTAVGGCDSIVTLTLTVNSSLAGSFNQTICTGNSYLFNGQNLITSGQYKDTLTAVGGCDSIVTLTLTVTPAVVGGFSHSICTGNSYLFNGQNLTLSGQYKDTLTTVGGCDSVVTLTLTVTPALTGGFNHSICNGNSYLFNGQNLTTSGQYKDTLTAVGGCDSVVTLTLTVNVALAGSYNHTICSGNSYFFNGQNLILTGQYKDTLTASGGCDSIVTLNLNVLAASASVQSITACSSQGFTLPNGTTVYSTGIYKDTVAASNGCDSVITYNITVNPSPVVTVSADVAITLGNSTTLTASGGSSYSWTPSTGLNTTSGATVIASPGITTTYCVIITGANGCSDTACVKITVETNCLSADQLGVPNAFSPNGDGINDEFCLQGWGHCMSDFTITIFDRWGEKVFESKDPNFCWDGAYQSKIMEAQVFVYYINAKHIVTGEKFKKNGNISLIR